MTIRIVILGLALFACGGGNDPVTPDVDAPDNLPACTNATYDPCTSNTECDSADCHLFMMDAIQVCTTPCTPLDNTTCPVDATGEHGECNMRGICKPAAQNACAR